MEFILLVTIGIISLISLITIFILLSKTKPHADLGLKIDDLGKSLARVEVGLKEEFRLNREEGQKVSRANREELNDSLKGLKTELSETLKMIVDQNTKSIKDVNQALDEKLQLLTKSSKDSSSELKTELEKSLKAIQENFDKNIESFNKIQKDKFEVLEKKQSEFAVSTEKKLDQMRETVEEKLQETLNKRIGQSFDIVGKQLQAVQEGLGEMRTLATDVGGLKRVLGGVKTRGGIGELQLSMLLEQVLAPEQYMANVKTKPGSSSFVEFAIKLPGQDEGLDQMWLPIDAKFPKDYYEQLILAQDEGDKAQIELAHKNLEAAIRKMAKDISDKYIDPPHTTNFGIMFLPFEGLYSEVVRKSSLMDELHRDYKISITGPSTLAAHLNCLQMGFKTLTIQKRSSEVWKVLGAVKTEFDKFGGLLEKSQKHFQAGVDDLDSLIGTRTRMIKSKLKSIESLTDGDTKLVLPEALLLEVDEEV